AGAGIGHRGGFLGDATGRGTGGGPTPRGRARGGPVGSERIGAPRRGSERRLDITPVPRARATGARAVLAATRGPSAGHPHLDTEGSMGGGIRDRARRRPVPALRAGGVSGGAPP